jgi:hypothetical protein
MLLREYNEFANQYCTFSVERFDNRLDNPMFHMGQSGPLGIKGNIVLSTALHGLALADITGTPDNDCVVGDDALTQVLTLLLSMFITCVNNLGTINPTKFSILKPTIVDPLSSTRFKFLKRPLHVTDRPVLGILDFFPDVATILYPEGDGVHTIPPGSSFYIRMTSFVMQVCRYSLIVSRPDRVISSLDEVFADDERRVMEVFRLCYKELGLPLDGAPPGHRVYDPDSDSYVE